MHLRILILALAYFSLPLSYVSEDIRVVEYMEQQKENQKNIANFMLNPVFSPYEVNLRVPMAPPKKIKIAVVDTGVDFSHPIFKGFKSSINDILTEKDLPSSHGTHVAGIIASNLRKTFGNQAPDLFEIASFQYEYDRTENIDSYNNALLAALAWEPDVINISITGTFSNLREFVLINMALERNIKIVAAAGNEYSKSPRFPCSYPGVLCVGSIGEDKQLSSFSNYGEHVLIYANGEDVLSSAKGGLFMYDSGTSQATPIVSAAVAASLANPMAEFHFNNLLMARSEVKFPVADRILASEPIPNLIPFDFEIPK